MEKTQKQGTLKKNISTTFLEYGDQVMRLRLKEGAEFDLDNTKEQFAAQDEMTGEENYAVLVDATQHVHITKEAREFMSRYQNPKRKATALLTGHNLATIILANFYMRLNKPLIPTRLFNREEDAMIWLREKLQER